MGGAGTLQVVVLDIRFPTLPVAELQRHQACVNALAWAPHSSCHICTAGDDSQALIWDLSSMSQSMDQGLGAWDLARLQYRSKGALVSRTVPLRLICSDVDVGFRSMLRICMLPRLVSASLLACHDPIRLLRCADPILAYSAGAEINQLQWCAHCRCTSPAPAVVLPALQVTKHHCMRHAGRPRNQTGWPSISVSCKLLCCVLSAQSHNKSPIEKWQSSVLKHIVRLMSVIRRHWRC